MNLFTTADAAAAEAQTPWAEEQHCHHRCPGPEPFSSPDKALERAAAAPQPSGPAPAGGEIGRAHV